MVEAMLMLWAALMVPFVNRNHERYERYKE
jgi:hypothetical protein